MTPPGKGSKSLYTLLTIITKNTLGGGKIERGRKILSPQAKEGTLPRCHGHAQRGEDWSSWCSPWSPSLL